MEVWKDISEYEGLYQVSDKGKVKSLNYKQSKKENILTPVKDKTGYYVVSLSKKGVVKRAFIHRLVGETFLDNSNNYPCINHIDGNKLNNDVSNLEFCTYGHNNKEAYRIGLNHPRVKPKKVNQYDLEGNFIKTWDGEATAGRSLNINQRNISSCCRGLRNNAGGYIWKFKEEEYEY